MIKFLVKITFFFTIFIIIAAVSMYFTFQMFTESKAISVPDLKGKSLIDANSLLSSLKLYLKIEGEDYHSKIPEGYILLQDKPPGSKIKEGRTISVYMSKGPRVQYMPDFRGLNLEEARQKASNVASGSRVSVGKIINVHSNTIGAGIVISQRPAPDESGGKDLTILVSMGAYDSAGITPELKGLNVDTAKQLTDRGGIKLEVHGSGSVIGSQSPMPGTKIAEGETVRVFLETPNMSR
ncbi:MAG: PASTA domain-containing protein [Candidatus Magnetoovum sp. WYHC-5]|nr:PASTA domain-containing protein [Candidatus Magnetoovum sp. WYHC-5]